VHAFDLEDTLRASDGANPFLEPGDVVRLPDADRAFVLGAVRAPGEVTLKGPVTLADAIASVGGLAEDADAGRVRILRRARESRDREEIEVDFGAIARRKASDVLLQPDDIVEVGGPSGARKFWAGLRQALIPASMQYPVRVIR
jgi:protein involved in polysaccharide export with SLBB domain